MRLWLSWLFFVWCADVMGHFCGYFYGEFYESGYFAVLEPWGLVD